MRLPSRPVAIAALIGVLAGALVTAAVFLAFGGSAFDASKATVTLPSRVGGYVPFDQIEINRRAQAKRMVDAMHKSAERNAALLSESFGGAAAAFGEYGDSHYDKGFLLKVVRATSPSPQFVMYYDAKYFGLATPPRELKRFGEVTCEIANTTTVAGQKPAPDSAVVVACQRTTSGLTVTVESPRGDLRSSAKEVAGIVDLAWNELA